MRLRSVNHRRSILTLELICALALAVVLGLVLAGSAAAATTDDIAGWHFTSIPQPGQYVLNAVPSGGKLYWIRSTEGVGTELVQRDLSTGQDTTLVSDDLTPRSFSVDGDHLAFTGYDGVDAEVFVLTLSTGKITKVTNNLFDDSPPKIGGDLVSWQEYSYGPTSNTVRVFVYDIAGGKTTEILALDQGNTGIQNFQVGDDWAVWQVYTYSNSMQKVATWAYSRATGKTIELTELAAATVQTLDGGSLYYTVDSAEHSELFALDLSSGKSTLVATNAKQMQSVRVSGTKVAWASWETSSAGTESYLAILDRSDGTTVRIPSPGYTVGSLELAGSLLKWSGESLAGKFMGAHAYVFVYDGARGTVTRVNAPGENLQSQGATDGYLVVFQRFYRVDGAFNADLLIARPTADPAPTFADVSGVSPYRTAIVALAERGVVSGYPLLDGVFGFRPDASLNRAQFCKMLAEALEVPVTEDLVPPFSDLGPDDPSNLYPGEYVAALTTLGIIKGTGSGHFSPYAGISRAQLVTLLVRAADTLKPGSIPVLPAYEFVPGTLGKFDSTHWKSMARAELAGLLDGLVGFGPKWDPWKPATRAEAAQLLWNLASMK
jgi:hypothetical protein